MASLTDSRVANTLSFMYAPHEHAQHPCHRVLSATCPGFLTVADIKGPTRRIGATHGYLTTPAALSSKDSARSSPPVNL